MRSARHPRVRETTAPAPTGHRSETHLCEEQAGGVFGVDVQDSSRELRDTVAAEARLECDALA